MIFVDELTRFARHGADQRVLAIAARTAAPLRVAVRGRPGVGCSTVAQALNQAGRPAGITVTTAPDAADLQVYVVAEVVKPEDAAGGAVLAVLTKADLSGFGDQGPIAAAHARCVEFSGLLGVPMLPMSGLLANAAGAELDGVWSTLRALADHPDALTCLDGSFDGYLAAPLPVPVPARRRLLEVLDLFGIAVSVAAVRSGAGLKQLQAMLRRVSGVDAVLEHLVAAGATARYRRVLDAVTDLEALAVSDPTIAAFLNSDDAVVARMAAALDAAQTCGLDPGPAAPLPRALHWQRSTPATGLHRACGADIVRGSLRLWSRSGGAPLREYREAR